MKSYLSAELKCQILSQYASYAVSTELGTVYFTAWLCCWTARKKVGLGQGSTHFSADLMQPVRAPAFDAHVQESTTPLSTREASMYCQWWLLQISRLTVSGSR